MIGSRDAKETAGADVADATTDETAAVTAMPLSISQTSSISRRPLGEGLRSLAAEGLVELIPNCGAVVANPPPEKTHEKLIVLGGWKGWWASWRQSATDEEIDEIPALHYEMLAARKRRNCIHLNLWGRHMRCAFFCSSPA